jgi:DNA-3-methyladenine glycosylase II
MSTKPRKSPAPALDRYAEAIDHLSRACPVMKGLIARVGPCTLAPKSDDPFTLLVRCVISQQISGKAATSISAKLTAALKGPPIDRAKLARMTEARFRACGVSGPKQRTLQALCAHLRANPDLLRGIESRDDAIIREQLVAIKGIGPWTVDMFLMFGMMRPDILPVGDLGLRMGVRDEFGLKELPKPHEIEKFAEPWRPFRSIATWYFWRRVGPVPQST